MSTQMPSVLRSAACMFLAALLCLSFMAPAVAEAAVTQADIDALKKQASGLNSKKSELKNQLSALSEDKDEAMKKKDLLDEQCAVIQEEIDNVNVQISQYETLIAQTEQQISETEEKEQAQYELFCQRVRAMEENGTVSYWEVIFKATSFTDLLSRIDFINEIMDYDERVIQDLKDLQAQLAEEKATLEESKAAQEEAKQELSGRKAELQTQLDEAIALMKKIQSQSDVYQDTLDALSQEEDEIQAQIVKKSQELAAQQAAGNNTSSGNASTGVVTSWMGSGGYMWPEKASKKINSPFGLRSSPGGIGSTNHKGVDIGGVGYTTQVLASKAGTVIVSQRSSSYGEYVVVSHGSGNTTLYAHMSKRLVSAGQTVQQGQVLGITGSTGNSTGPHLHFEITEGGVRVDPLQYLTGYIKNW